MRLVTIRGLCMKPEGAECPGSCRSCPYFIVSEVEVEERKPDVTVTIPPRK